MLWSTYETANGAQMLDAKNIYDTLKWFKWTCAT